MNHIILAVSYRADQMEKELKAVEEKVGHKPFSNILYLNNYALCNENMPICDIVSEKVSYCGTNSVILDQLFSHFYGIIFYQHCAGSNKNVCFRCS